MGVGRHNVKGPVAGGGAEPTEDSGDGTVQDSTHSLAEGAAADASEADLPGPAPSDLSGPTLGRYALRSVLGRGGMGIVYDAWDPALGRQVAIKMLSVTAGMSTHGRVRFQREARAVARLDHPHIIRVHDIGEVGGNIYLVMPKLEGPTLRGLLKAGPLPPARAAEIAKVLAEALGCAHAAGLVHRDVKPSNVILEGGHRVVLTDFGVAKDLTLPASDLTQDRRLIGTPAYMAPEQRAGENAAVGPAADIFALGVVLWECLTGARPEIRGDGGRILDPKAQGDVPRPLRAICARATRVEAEERYPSALAMAEDLGRYLRGEPVHAARMNLGRRLHAGLRAPTRLRWGALIAGILLLALASNLGMNLWRAQTQRARERTALARLEALQTHLGALREAGDRAGADAALQRFVSLDSNARTRAIALAWLAHAEGLEDTDLKLESLARAYGAATEGASRDAALLGLAQTYAAQGRWTEVSAVLRTAALRSPDLLKSPKMARLEAARDLASRDFQRVAEGPAGPEVAPLQRLARALTTATATAHVYDGEAVALLEDPRELLLFSRGEARARALSLGDPSLPEAWSSDLPPGAGPALRAIALQGRGDGDGAEVLTWHEASGQGALMGREDASLRILHTWPSAAIGDALRLDLDRDGAGEIYVGTLAYQRDLQVLRPEGEGWRHAPAHRPTSLAASDIVALAPIDADGDGSDELALTAGPWVAYDLRVLGPGQGDGGDEEGGDQKGRDEDGGDEDGGDEDAGEEDGGDEQGGDEDGLELVARRQMGTLSAIERVSGPPDRILAFKANLFPNPQIFSPLRPFGPEEGLYILRMEAGHLLVEDALPVPEGWYPERTLAADVDGDGRQDVVAWRVTAPADRALVALQGPEGRFTLASIEGITPLAAAQLDGDAALELIVSLNDGGRRIYVLGAGEGAVPPREMPFLTPPPPPEGDPDMVALWERADDLAFIGLPTPAARLMEELASLTLDDAVAELALLRAADLFQAGDRPEEAASVLEACADLGGARAPQALASAAQLRERYNDTEAAVEAWAALASLPGASAALKGDAEDALARLTPLLGPGLNVSLDGPLPLRDGWLVDVSRGIRWNRGEGGLDLDFIAEPGRRALARRPMRWSGEPITLNVDLTLTRLEWGAQIFVGLRSEAGERFGFMIAGSGGRAMLQRDIRCIAGGSEPLLQAPSSGPEEKLRLRLRLDLMEDGRARCAVAEGDTEPLRAIAPPVPTGLTPGDYALEIGSGGGRFLGYQHARAHLAALSLRGLTPLPVERRGDVVRGIYLDLTRGATGLAERRLAGAEGALDAIDALLLTAQIAEDGGEAERAGEAFEAALRAGLDGPAHRPALLSLLRGGPERFNAPTRAVLGDEAWLEAFGEAWQVAAALHETDPVVGEALIHGLDAGLIAELGERAPLPVIDLLYARGHVWRARAQYGLALNDLSRALALLEKVAADPAQSPAQVQVIPRLRSELLIDLAELQTQRGSPEAALASLRGAQSVSPIPEITLDRIAASEALRPLHEAPEWRSLVGDAPRWTDLPRVKE